MLYRLAFFTALIFSFTADLSAGIHRAPIIIQADQIKQVSRYPLKFYRFYRSDSNGKASHIPYQLDEVNDYGDYILNQGKNVNQPTSNGIFDGKDELSFMGDDVGEVRHPTQWPKGEKPNLVYELKLQLDRKDGGLGAVYIGLFFRSPPPRVERKYVIFDLNADVIRTARYEYHFDKKNYLVVKKIDMVGAEAELPPKTIVDSSTFYMSADLKYFLTVSANHRSVNSQLEAYKVGPVRTIVRVNFVYSFLSLKFEVGMYTEVSFFSNSVILPAVIYNPIDGIRRLNEGSGFYYGFALNNSPDQYTVATNMEKYGKKSSGLLSLLKAKKMSPLYWASLLAKDHMIYLEMRPSEQMLKDENIPTYYTSKETSGKLKSRSNDKILPLGESPVNLALYFDLKKFSKGDHLMSFQLFFENRNDPKIMDSFKSLSQWKKTVTRL